MKSGLIIPPGYRPLLNVRETELAIRSIKAYFEEQGVPEIYERIQAAAK